MVTSGHRNSIRSGVVSCFDKGLLDQCGLIFSQPSLYGLLLDRPEANTSADDERVERVAQGWVCAVQTEGGEPWCAVGWAGRAALRSAQSIAHTLLSKGNCSSPLLLDRALLVRDHGTRGALMRAWRGCHGSGLQGGLVWNSSVLKTEGFSGDSEKTSSRNYVLGGN